MTNGRDRLKIESFWCLRSLDMIGVLLLTLVGVVFGRLLDIFLGTYC